VLTSPSGYLPFKRILFYYSILNSNLFHSIPGDQLNARTMFDREEKKMYQIPIAITDSGKNPMTGTSILTVIIGDQNDNPMKFGESSIFVYNYKVGTSPANN
jgi:hypothetical protein